MKRNFKVEIESPGKSLSFSGKNCDVKNKSILARIGLKKEVKETISCDEF